MFSLMEHFLTFKTFKIKNLKNDRLVISHFFTFSLIVKENLRGRKEKHFY